MPGLNMLSSVHIINSFQSGWASRTSALLARSYAFGTGRDHCPCGWPNRRPEGHLSHCMISDARYLHADEPDLVRCDHAMLHSQLQYTLHFSLCCEGHSSTSAASPIPNTKTCQKFLSADISRRPLICRIWAPLVCVGSCPGRAGRSAQRT